MNSQIKDLLKVVLVPIHKEGYKFIAIFGAVTILLAMFSSFLGTIGIVLTLWCIFFFRDPERFTPEGDNLVISPADGIVNEVQTNAAPPPELELDEKIKWNKISIFLNVFNVHVNRVPISGKITKLNYQKGEFLSANLGDASTRNERQSAVVKTKNGTDVVFVQVAGLVARRIICDLEENQEVKAGERYGIIRFGSRADIYLPEGCKINLSQGQTMIGGETVIAQISSASKAKVNVKVPAKKAPVKKVVKKKVIKKAAKK